MVYGQGFAAGPFDAAVSQTVSDSVRQAQEQQHLDDLTACTRQQQEAVLELSSSPAVYNNGDSAAGAQPQQQAGPAAAVNLPGTGSVRAQGDRGPPPREEASVPSTPEGSAAAAGAPAQPRPQQANGAAVGAAGRQPKQSVHAARQGAPAKSQALGARTLARARKAGSLQGSRQFRAGRPGNTRHTQSSA